MATDAEIRAAGFKYIPKQEYLQDPFKLPIAPVPPVVDQGIVNTNAFINSGGGGGGDENIYLGYDDKIGAAGASPFLNIDQADFNKQLFETGPYADPYGQTLADYKRNPMLDPLNQKIVDKLREDRAMDATYTDEELINMFGSQNFKDGDEEFNLMDYIPYVGDKSAFQGIMSAIIPQQDSRFTDIRSYYGGPDNLDSMGRIKTGLMAGYAPVSGGFLNTITGGKYGSPTTYGLQRAYQKRIDTINKTLKRRRKKGLSDDDTVLDERLAKLKAEKAAEQKALQTAQAKKDYETIQDAYDTQTGQDSGYSGGERTTSVGGQDITTYDDPFDPGGGE
jgi:hypothetical protein